MVGCRLFLCCWVATASVRNPNCLGLVKARANQLVTKARITTSFRTAALILIRFSVNHNCIQRKGKRFVLSADVIQYEDIVYAF